MKKIHTRILLVLFLPFQMALAQEKHDFTWVLGYAPNNQNNFFGGNKISFSEGDPMITYFPIIYDMDNPVCMSDEEGNLQFYSSGCDVVGANHQTIQNGEELSPGFFHDYYCNDNSLGYLSYQAILSLPLPGHPGQYALFHNRQFQGTDSTEVMYSVVDMNQQGGQGAVVLKNQVLQYSFITLTYTAVRHANGRDWWVVVPRQNSEVYYFYLLDPAGIHGPYTQQVDDSWIPGQYYNLMCAFSPDGSKFVRLGGDQPAAFRLYDVDRCTGMLYNPVTIPVPDTIMYAAWACFSPNSRYLYLTNEVERLYQYDLLSPDIGSSVTFIDSYDGFLSVYNLPTGLHAMCLGPDNRIYMSSANGVNILHTIHAPDSPGLDCRFRQHDVVLPGHILFFLPNNVHYRLYNEPGSACDTLGVLPPIVAFWRAEKDTAQGALYRQLVNLSYYQPDSYHWDFGDGSTSTEPSPAHLFPAPGTYEVCLTACSNGGDCDTLCKSIDIIVTGNSIAFDHKLPLEVYPNPTDARCWLSYTNEQAGVMEFVLLNTLGQKVLHQTLQKGNNMDAIDTSVLPAGLYYWSVQTNGASQASGLLVVER
jgi:hypothetical protein